MKILITGVKGQLGYELQNMLKDKTEVVGVDIDELDITDMDGTVNFVKEIAPEVIINCAAFTNVDGCESNINTAYKVNGIGAYNLARSAVECGAKLVHISTDYVFDGKKDEPYNEFEMVNPMSIYGKSKYAGEKLVRETCPAHFILRTAWLYGINGNNFVKTMLKLADQQDVVKVVNDQHGTPTYAKDLAETICRLIETNHFGTYHVTNNGECTWYDFAQKIFELAGCKDVNVLPITTEELNRPAPRPAYSVMRNYMLELTIGDTMRPWEEALQEYMDELREHGLVQGEKTILKAGR